jgi:hypothetical protein
MKASYKAFSAGTYRWDGAWGWRVKSMVDEKYAQGAALFSVGLKKTPGLVSGGVCADVYVISGSYRLDYDDTIANPDYSDSVSAELALCDAAFDAKVAEARNCFNQGSALLTNAYSGALIAMRTASGAVDAIIPNSNQTNQERGSAISGSCSWEEHHLLHSGGVVFLYQS